MSVESIKWVWYSLEVRIFKLISGLITVCKFSVKDPERKPFQVVSQALKYYVSVDERKYAGFVNKHLSLSNGEKYLL